MSQRKRKSDENSLNEIPTKVLKIAHGDVKSSVESFDEVSDDYSIVSNSPNVPGNGSINFNHANIHTMNVSQHFELPSEASHHQSKQSIGIVVTEKGLDRNMAFFEFAFEDPWLNKRIRFGNVAQLELHECTGWLLLLVNWSDGWSAGTLKKLRRSFRPDLLVEFTINASCERTQFFDYLNDQSVKAYDGFDLKNWQYDCDCNEDHKAERTPEVQTTYSQSSRACAIQCPNPRVATCCTAWMFAEDAQHRADFHSRMVLIQVVTKSDINDFNFRYELYKVFHDVIGICLKLRKTNSTEMILAVPAVTWVHIWAWYQLQSTTRDEQAWPIVQARRPKLLGYVKLPLKPVAPTVHASVDSVVDEHLQELYLKSNQLPDLSHYESLTRLVVQSTAVDCTLLTKLTTLQSLALVAININDPQLQYVTSNLTNLHELSLRACNSLSLSSLTHLARLSLTRLDLSACYWLNNQAGDTLRTSPVKELSLRDCTQLTNIDSFGFVSHLDISGCWQISRCAMHTLARRAHINITKLYECLTHPLFTTLADPTYLRSFDECVDEYKQQRVYKRVIRFALQDRCLCSTLNACTCQTKELNRLSLVSKQWYEVGCHVLGKMKESPSAAFDQK